MGMLELCGSVDDVQRMTVGPCANGGCSLLQLPFRLIHLPEPSGKPAFLNCFKQIGQDCVLGHRRQRAPLGLGRGSKQIRWQLDVVDRLGAYEQYHVVRARNHL